MDLNAKIDELSKLYSEKERQKAEIHEEMKAIKKKIFKYVAVLKHAESIESVEEKPLVNAEAK